MMNRQDRVSRICADIAISYSDVTDGTFNALINHVRANPPSRRSFASELIGHIPVLRKRIKAVARLRVLTQHAQSYVSIPDFPTEPIRYKIDSIPNRILYLIHNCRPFQNGGYAVRAHGIVTGLRAHGYDVIPLARAGYPYDVLDVKDAPERIDVDGIEYRFFPRESANRAKMSREEYSNAYFDALCKIVEDVRPAVIHAASFFHNAHVALRIRERYGIPVVYEVRGLSILTDMSKPQGPDLHKNVFPYPKRYWEFREEVELAKRADRLLCITTALADLFKSVGVPSEKISVLANCAMDEWVQEPMRSNVPSDGFVLGYLGSIQRYEGIELIIGAVERLADERPDLNVSALIVGDGPHGKELKKRVAATATPDKIKLLPRVPHEEIGRYYDMCSAMVFPRLSLPVSEIISPIKPLEAMAKGIPVIASDVAAMAEIVRNDETGYTFPAGNLDALVSTIEQLASGLDSSRICASARRFVETERNWHNVTRPLTSLYDNLYRSASTDAVIHPDFEDEQFFDDEDTADVWATSVA